MLRLIIGTLLVSKWKYNLGQNICSFLAQFAFTTTETELEYYYQKVNVRVAVRVTERLKTWDLKKLWNLKKILEMLGFDSKYPAVHERAKLWRFPVKRCKKSAVKQSIEKPILLNSVNLSPTFCSRLQIYRQVFSEHLWS